jgi:hypothetical protein
LAQVTSPVNTPPDEAAIQQIFQLTTGFMVSAALGVVAQLGVADHLADGPRSTPDLAARTGANEDALYRVLRALATTGIFTETSSRTFALTPSGALLRSNVPGSMRDMVLWLCDSFHFRVYAEMAHSVRTGETLGDKLLGMPVFEYLQHNPELAARFNNAMTNFSAGIAPAVLEAYDFGGIDVLVDVAGGHGMLLASVLRKYPSMRGILFDVEHVIAGAKAPEALGVADRCDKVSGDFFKAVPRGGDAYVLKSIIHDWDDEKAGAILRNTRAALEGKPSGKVLLVEAVIKPGNELDLSKLGDLEMMLLPGGRERTEAEFAALFARNGFQLTRVVPTHAPLWVVEAQVR